MTHDAAPPLDNGRYRLVDVLGQGGMASVYRAYDNRLQVWRAIKVLDEKLADRGSLRTRFDNEARTMARLHHRNIVTVHDVGHEGARVYLVMELVDGGSLAGWVEQHGSMPPRMAIDLMREVLGALQIAHDNGVVHRDVKPHNILVDRDGTPKVSDFGIARLADTDHSLTRTGAMMGTWTYMAPEQRTSARRVDARADVYAAGATLFALLTAREPYDLYTTDLHEELFAGMPEDLANVIKRATRYRPEDRYPSALAMRSALEELRGGYAVLPVGTPPITTADSGVSAPPPPPLLEPVALAASAKSDPTLHPGATWMGGTAGMQVATAPTALPVEAPVATAIPEGEGTLSDDIPPVRPLRPGEATAAEESARRGPIAPWILVLLLVLVVAALVTVVGGLGAALVFDLGGSSATTELSATGEGTDEPLVEPAPVVPEPILAALPAPVPEPVAAPDPVAEPVPAPADPPAPVAPEPRPIRAAPVPRIEPVPAPAPVEVRTRPAAPTGTLGLSTVPYFSEATIDGEKTGRTPWTVELPEGSHTVVLVGSKGGRAELTVDVVAGERKVVCWDFASGEACRR